MEEERLKNNENISPTCKQQFLLAPPKVEQSQFDDEPEPMTTKIYYFIDEQQIPFATEIPIPPSKITLVDFKKCISRRNYRYYCKLFDPALNAEVKTDIRDEHEVLKPNSTNGRFELFLLSENQTRSSASTLPIQQLHQPFGGGIRASLMGKRASAHYTYDPPKSRFIEDSSYPEGEDTNLRLFGESNFAGSLSDGDSQYTTDFTSVSQQQNQLQHIPSRRTFPDLLAAYPPNPNNRPATNNNKRYDANNKPMWAREKRKRMLRKSYSTALSSTFEDTEVSMALDLITVVFNLDTRRPFGMSIVTKNTRTGYAGIYVHSLNPGGLVALDGRIQPGFIVLEVNDLPLDDIASEDALKLIISAVRHATETRGQLKLTCARSEPTHESGRNMFHPVLAEPVRPIDPTAWVQHTNAARGLDHIVLQDSHQQFMQQNHQPMMPASKSATMPKTILPLCAPAGQGQMSMQASKTFADSELPAAPANFGAIRMIQNPSNDITTTSDHSSLECSIGQIAPSPKKKGGGGGGKGGRKKKGKGGIGSALRRLVCIRAAKRRSGGGGRKGGGGGGSGKSAMKS